MQGCLSLAKMIFEGFMHQKDRTSEISSRLKVFVDMDWVCRDKDASIGL